MRVSHQNLRETHIIGDDTPEQLVVAEACRSLGDAGITATGLSDAGRGYHMVRLRPQYSHLLVCFSGRGQVLIDDRWEICTAGNAYLAPPLVPHAFQTIRNQRWGFCWVFHQHRRGESPLIDLPAPLLAPVDPRYLRSCIDGLYREFVNAADPSLMSPWAQLIAAYANRLADPFRRHDRLWKVWETVDRNLSTKWTLARLADLAMLSEEHVRRLCMQHTGKSPMQEVTRLRMRRAAALLESTPAKIAAIAANVGYESPFAFSTAFRRITGVTPNQYRQTRRAR
jgi:AraC-like DNA-binding protein